MIIPIPIFIYGVSNIALTPLQSWIFMGIITLICGIITYFVKETLYKGIELIGWTIK